MPTYTCTTPANRLTPEQRARLAQGITRTHSEVTGAAGYFAQVLFHEVPHGSYFVGGAPLGSDQIFIHGQIRAGRSAQDRHRLIARLIAVASEAAGLPANGVWVYVLELPARCMAEYGHVLPEPGDEAAWAAALPAADRDRMQSIRAP